MTFPGGRPLAAPLRHGLSLLEVLLALAILGGSIAAIGQLMHAGARSAERSRDLTTAQVLAETIMGEIVIGLIPVQSTPAAPVSDPQHQDEWQYALAIEPIDQEGLVAVQLTVQQNPGIYSRPASLTVVRWMQDPAMATTSSLDDSLDGSAAAPGGGG